MYSQKELTKLKRTKHYLRARSTKVLKSGSHSQYLKKETQMKLTATSQIKTPLKTIKAKECRMWSHNRADSASYPNKVKKTIKYKRWNNKCITICKSTKQRWNPGKKRTSGWGSSPKDWARGSSPSSKTPKPKT